MDEQKHKYKQNFLYVGHCTNNQNNWDKRDIGSQQTTSQSKYIQHINTTLNLNIN